MKTPVKTPIKLWAKVLMMQERLFAEYAINGGDTDRNRLGLDLHGFRPIVVNA